MPPIGWIAEKRSKIEAGVVQGMQGIGLMGEMWRKDVIKDMQGMDEMVEQHGMQLS